MKQTVLCFVFDRARDSLLMIEKKRGQGTGKVNVPGGKIHPGESAPAAAARETAEETGLTPTGLREAGKLSFTFPGGRHWDNACTVFTAEEFSGVLLPETEECRAFWVRVGEIPLARMWDADRRWLPLLLRGEWFHRAYEFGEDDQVRTEKVLS